MYEVTQEQYEKVVGRNPAKFRDPRKPGEGVTWDDAQAFCRRLSETESKKYRLPTAVEWEYACRAGTTTEYYWGNDWEDGYTWTDKSSGGSTRQVGTAKPNPWGLYDMCGNVWEWCQDTKGTYAPGAETDPVSLYGSGRVLRGGSWHSTPQSARSANRNYYNPPGREDVDGFREVLAAQE